MFGQFLGENIKIQNLTPVLSKHEKAKTIGCKQRFGTELFFRHLSFRQTILVKIQNYIPKL